ncbi:chorismate mutase [Stomatohabitans albus]|uniref:chorismate mutase n=1 Tax=Stomatohabitans albus TaxID=3110766 RepID=UPI00300C40A2
MTVDPRLQALRDQIDVLDAELIALMGRRFDVTRAVGVLKREIGLPKADPAREERQITRLRTMASDVGLDEEFSERLLRLIIDEVIRDYARKGSNSGTDSA